MKWISHRGESFDAPENTCEAFELSNTRQTEGMECDIRFTADNILVVNHDYNTLRTTGVDCEIAKSTFADLQKLDSSNNKESYRDVRIPRFADTLKYLGNREYYVEVKIDDEEILHAMVRELDAAEKKSPDIEDLIVSRQEAENEANKKFDPMDESDERLKDIVEGTA